MPKVTEQYSEARRQEIIDAAYRCFARKGFHPTTMRDIFAEAGLSPGAVYHYFKSKDEIIEASFSFDYARSLPVFEQIAAEPDPVAALERLLDFFFAGIESAAALGADRVNILGWGEAMVNPRLEEPLREFSQAFRDLVQGLIQRGQAAGHVNPAIDPQAAAELFLSSFIGLYVQKALVPDMDVRRYRGEIGVLMHRYLAPAPLSRHAHLEAKDSTNVDRNLHA